MSEIPRTLGKKAFANYIGCAPSYVTKLRKDGRLVLTPNGRGVRVAESLKLMAETRGGRDDVTARWAALAGRVIPEVPEAAPEAPAPPSGGEEAGGGVRLARAEAEARKATAQAEQEEMKSAQMRGDLIPRDDVEAALRFVGAAIRGQLDVLPDQTAPLVAPITALDEVHAMLQDACRNALEALGQAIQRQRDELGKGAPK
jgi:phage terminase Nu1 subunit (DNA packaging protein)